MLQDGTTNDLIFGVPFLVSYISAVFTLEPGDLILTGTPPGVGFALTLSTTYHHPFHCARVFNALDHVTRGRIAWNAVTSAYKNEAANYGFDEMMEHDERYVRAQEFLEVAFKLWDSIEPDALILDRERGIYADPKKVHRIDHRGRYFNVRGPLPALPSPQRRPVVIQAGLSGPGMQLAATYAELQFSTRRTLASMKQHRAALDAALLKAGRKPRDIGILWSIRIEVADSDAHAAEKERRYLESIPPEAGLVEMSAQYGVDFSTAKPGMRLADFADEVRAQKGNLGSFEELLKTTDPNQSLKDFAYRFLVDRILTATGTPQKIADILEELHHETGANGGFILGRGYSATGNIADFVDHVVPELQRRGLAKTKYAGPTLRENLNA